MINSAIQSLSAKASTGIGTVIDVSDKKYIDIYLVGASTPSMTVKVQGGYSVPGGSAPDFTASASGTNHWGYVESRLINNDAQVVGSTGHVITTTAAVWARVNVSQMQWICLEVAAWVSGNVSGWVYMRTENVS